MPTPMQTSNKNTYRPYKKHNKNKKVSPQNNVTRDREIKQCQHSLSHRQFKLFKQTTHTTSYGFIQGKDKYIISIPLTYPRQPIKLQESEHLSPSLVRNFNNKCKNDKDKGTPILAQLNYLIVNKQVLSTHSTQQFANMSNLNTIFYNQFV